MSSRLITAVRAGLLIDGTGTPPIRKPTICIEGSKIVAVGDSKDVKVPKEATVVDASDKTAMPGLIDMHLHLGTVTDDPKEPNTGYRKSLAAPEDNLCV